MVPKRALIHGTGLIGASVGMALRASGWKIAGWDPDPGALRTALALGALDAAVKGPGDGLDSDVVILAGPPSAIVRAVSTMVTLAIVTDVASVKAGVVSAAGPIRFVGGHPMAGRETSGPDGASADLFDGAAWVLTTDRTDSGDLEAVEDLVRSMGARPVRMQANDHDAAVARVSHLPRVLAAVLVQVATSHRDARGLAAGSFRDLTRVAAWAPGWWTEVLAVNREEVIAALDELSDAAAAWRHSLISQDLEAISTSLERAARDHSGVDTGPARHDR